MVKLQDFARECGVTDRAIQKHIKKYADELEGLYQRKGANGTWLTEEACEILRGKLKQQPLVIGDSEVYRQGEELRQKVDSLQEKLIQAYEKIDAQQILLDQGQADRLMLQAAEEQARKTGEGLAVANQMLGAAQQEAKMLKESMDRQILAAKAAEDREQQAQKELEKLQQQLETVKRMKPWQRAFWKGN